MTFAENVAEHVALQSGIGNADLRGVIGKTKIAVRKEVDVVNLGPSQTVSKDSSIKISIDVVDSRHRVKVKVYSSMDGSHGQSSLEI